ncbi:uncharacterized protein LOC128883937 [Hylaeus volcanicus]|uniref:uncharacterized protein LOC128883937 n=1 Tax=Hylaeus volcanicus TaxID=313075 RepID=UPI0023B83B45|nr:uncharacterized protein LOC128883937 [Hylaeus volcanicus]
MFFPSNTILFSGAVKTTSMLSSPYLFASSPLVNLLQTKVLQSNEKKFSILILYSTETKTTEQFCVQLAHTLCEWNTRKFSNRCCITVRNAALYDFQGKSLKTFPASLPCFETLANYQIVILCISTWVNGSIPTSGKNFYDFFYQENFPSHSRYQALRSVKGFCVLCFGNSDYDQFCTCGIQIYQKLKKLDVHFLLPLIKIDEVHDTQSQQNSWIQKLSKALNDCILNEKHVHQHVNKKSENQLYPLVSSIKPRSTTRTWNNVTNILENTVVPEKKITHVVDDDTETTQSVSSNEEEEDFLNDIGACESNKADVEDIPLPSTHHEMLSIHQRNQLVKEGYKIVGTHSAVKLCRWTKSQLRGRGGCYKHTFYGIESYSCMEATPSLACANKCVFCWRHHKNPVGTTWKWDMDDPDLILKGIMEGHKQMVKQLKGVAGVDPLRFESAVKTIKHCALSLVGEPIMYPKFSQLLTKMHEKKISTFVVTNAQFPDALKSLPPVTQLYVSVDAATPETLKAIDRPLFSDYWSRFMECLQHIRHVSYRTVFRLTLVKTYNMQEAENFGKLVLMGIPDFIEIKAVTYSGTAASSKSITMKDIPWHEEVIKYAQSILQSNPLLQETYQIASEHQHSCCILIAHKKFFINNEWHTWIDYPKFFQLVHSKQSFTSLDYCFKCPSWANYGSNTRGFDPIENRVYSKGSKKRAQKASCNK